jgi:shikimate kinase
MRKEWATETEIKAEWDKLPKDWSSIYKWHFEGEEEPKDRTSKHRYAKWIVPWIVDSFDKIRLETEGVREQGFNTEDHRGQLGEEQINRYRNKEDIQSGKAALPFNEERFSRALYNSGNSRVLGKMLGYEVPFQAPGAANADKHADIDLLCQTSDAILCVEAKNAKDNHAILRTILQAYVDTSFAAIRHDQFVDDFGLLSRLPFTPAILIGKKSEGQLDELAGEQNLSELVRKFNGKLKGLGAGEFRYFVVTNAESELKDCLRIQLQGNHDYRVVFKTGFTPSIEEWRHPAAPRRIVLTGFMGSGKTTVGPLIAARLGWSFVDVDDAIEAEAGTTIAEIFARHGEAVFREREHAAIARLAAGDALVLALGGGAIENPATRALLLTAPGTLLVHLEVELATTLARCRGTEHVRPILADQANLASRYQRRLPLYRTAHVSIPVDALTPDEVVDAVLRAARLT